MRTWGWHGLWVKRGIDNVADGQDNTKDSNGGEMDENHGGEKSKEADDGDAADLQVGRGLHRQWIPIPMCCADPHFKLRSTFFQNQLVTEFTFKASWPLSYESRSVERSFHFTRGQLRNRPPLPQNLSKTQETVWMTLFRLEEWSSNTNTRTYNNGFVRPRSAAAMPREQLVQDMVTD